MTRYAFFTVSHDPFRTFHFVVLSNRVSMRSNLSSLTKAQMADTDAPFATLFGFSFRG